jgi:hypothetical protein
LTTLAVGWLGVISLLVTSIFVINNVVRCLSCLSLGSAPTMATKAETQSGSSSVLDPTSRSVYLGIASESRTVEGSCVVIMQPTLDPVLVEIMGASGADPDHCLTLAKKLEAWAMELRIHAATVSTGRLSESPDLRFDPPSGFSSN